MQADDLSRWEDEGGYVRQELDHETVGFRIGDYVQDEDGNRGYITTFQSGKIYTSISVFSYWPYQLTRLSDY